MYPSFLGFKSKTHSTFSIARAWAGRCYAARSVLFYKIWSRLWAVILLDPVQGSNRITCLSDCIQCLQCGGSVDVQITRTVLTYTILPNVWSCGPDVEIRGSFVAHLQCPRRFSCWMHASADRYDIRAHHPNKLIC